MEILVCPECINIVDEDGESGHWHSTQRGMRLVPYQKFSSVEDANNYIKKETSSEKRNKTSS